jgi:hypothetical protein
MKFLYFFILIRYTGQHRGIFLKQIVINWIFNRVRTTKCHFFSALRKVVRLDGTIRVLFVSIGNIFESSI